MRRGRIHRTIRSLLTHSPAAPHARAPAHLAAARAARPAAAPDMGESVTFSTLICTIMRTMHLEFSAPLHRKR
jgi:hypothetical protein